MDVGTQKTDVSNFSAKIKQTTEIIKRFVSSDSCHKSPGQCNIVVYAILAKFTLFFWKIQNSRLFCTFSWKAYTPKINKTCKIQETKWRMCTWISWFAKKVICTTYVVLWFFGSDVKWQKCTYDYIALTRQNDVGITEFSVHMYSFTLLLTMLCNGQWHLELLLP